MPCRTAPRHPPASVTHLEARDKASKCVTINTTRVFFYWVNKKSTVRVDSMLLGGRGGTCFSRLISKSAGEQRLLLPFKSRLSACKIRKSTQRWSYLFWWARRDLNPQGLFSQRILSPPRIPIPPLAPISAFHIQEHVPT